MLNLKYFYSGFFFFTLHMTGLLYDNIMLENKEIKKINISVNKICRAPAILRVAAFLCFTISIKNIVNKNVYFILFLLNSLWYINTIYIYHKYLKNECKNDTICDIPNILLSSVLFIYLFLFFKLL